LGVAPTVSVVDGTETPPVLRHVRGGGGGLAPIYTFIYVYDDHDGPPPPLLQLGEAPAVPVVDVTETTPVMQNVREWGEGNPDKYIYICI